MAVVGVVVADVAVVDVVVVDVAGAMGEVVRPTGGAVAVAGVAVAGVAVAGVAVVGVAVVVVADGAGYLRYLKAVVESVGEVVAH